MHKEFRLLLSVLLLVALTFSFSSEAAETRLTVQVPPAKEECFYEDVREPESTVFFSFLVTLGGAQDIDATIYTPAQKILWRTEGVSEDRALFNARTAGLYMFCFSNRMSTVSSKVVSFGVATRDSSVGPDGKRKPKEDKITRSVNQLLASLGELESLQDYLRVREREHRSTVEVANTRVIMWCIIEVVVIIGLALFNVRFLRKMFTTRRFV